MTPDLVIAGQGRMKLPYVLSRMQSGARLRMQWEGPARFWWLDGEDVWVPPTVVEMVLADPRVRPCADTMIAGTAPQSWEWRAER